MWTVGARPRVFRVLWQFGHQARYFPGYLRKAVDPRRPHLRALRLPNRVLDRVAHS
jgi:hypothetical protein